MDSDEAFNVRKKGMKITAKIGHNSNLNGDEKLGLDGYVKEIELLEWKISELNEHRGTIYVEAKRRGFDTKALRALIRLRKMERAERDAYCQALDAYMHALGEYSNTPLGQAMAPHGQQHPG